MFQPFPKRFFLVAGKGEASTQLNAFDAALLQAGIGDTNLIRMSSILPPACVEIDSYDFPKGSFVPLAYGEISSSEPGTVISAAVAVGIPEDESESGLIMECARVGDEGPCLQRVLDMVREGMEQIRKRPIRDIRSISVSYKVKRAGSVVAAVVLCP